MPEGPARDLGQDSGAKAWQQDLLALFKREAIRHVAYVPDAGHKGLIAMARQDPALLATALTSEEEGMGLLAGAWLGGERGVLLMQSSGVGNCINALAMTAAGRFPLVMLVTMRGEWAEFNPWQVPMSKATRPSLEAVGVKVARVDAPGDVVETVDAALALAYGADQAIAVLLGQRLIGRKRWQRGGGGEP